MRTYLVTGGAGFIGSNYIHYMFRKYGNEIRRFIAQKTNNLYIPNEQSLYSAYHRLEDMECIKGFWGDNIGAQRKYYTITERGKQQYELNKREWENAKRLIDILIK